MPRLLVLLAALAFASATAVLVGRAGAAGDGTTFRTPDAAAACRLERTTLVCSSLGSRGSIALRARSGAAVVARLPWWDASTPVLRTWRRDGIACRLAARAILCRSGSTSVRVTGTGFAVAG